MKTIIASIVIAATLSSTASAQYYYNNDYYYEQQEQQRQQFNEFVERNNEMGSQLMDSAIQNTCNGGRAYGPCSYR